MQILLFLPTERVPHGIAGYRNCLVAAKTFDRLSLGIQRLDYDLASLGIRIQHQRITQEQEWPGRQRTTIRTAVD